MKFHDRRPEGEELIPLPRTLPTLQSREVRDVTSGQKVTLKVFAHGPGYLLPERVVVEVDSGLEVTLRLSADDAAWLGHTLLSAQDDALRLAGPDYADSPAGNERIIDDHKAQQRAEDSSAFDAYQHGAMDPRD